MKRIIVYRRLANNTANNIEHWRFLLLKVTQIKIKRKYQ